MKKEAIWSQMPVGDPNLPGQLTERDIGGGPEGDIAYDQKGKSEIGGRIIRYTYDYDYDSNKAFNIKPLIEEYEVQIRNDIEQFEEDAKIEKQPGYGQQEYDPADQFDDIGF